MSYNVRLYKNTGFNAVNIPYSPNLLDEFDYIDVQPIDVLQDRLSFIDVRINWENVQDCDYCRVNQTYYYIIDFSMSSPDVCRLKLAINFILTAGGIANLTILSGLTERILFWDHGTNDLSLRELGYICNNDPYLLPALETDYKGGWQHIEAEMHTFVESTVDLLEMGEDESNFLYHKTTVYQTTIGSNNYTVSVPESRPLTRYTDFGTGISTRTILYDLDAPGNPEYSQKQQVLKGIERCRALGIEGAIVNQFSLSTRLVDITYRTIGRYPSIEVQRIVGKPNLTGDVTGWSYDYSGDYGIDLIHPEIMLTGASSIGMISASGESVEISPCDTAIEANPSFKIIVDPHSDGRPYYIFNDYERAVTTMEADKWFYPRTAGLQWKQIPLYFSTQSGNLLNTLRYDLASESLYQQGINAQQSRDLALQKYDYDLASNYITSTARGAYEGAMTASKNGEGASGIIAGTLAGTIGPMIGTGTTIIANNYGAGPRNELEYQLNGALEQSLRTLDYQIAKEALEYGIQNYSAVKPTIMFPYNTETLRDYEGNGVFCYKRRLRKSDLLRLDRIISAYGYAFQKVLTPFDLDKGRLFNYVKANVSVGGALYSTTGTVIKSFPKWLCDGISSQLSGGVRIWKVRPSGQLIHGAGNAER